MKQRLGKHAIGRWCKLGAWVIALLGVVQVVGILISRSAAQPFLAPGSGPLQPYYFVMLFLQPILSVATYTVFYVLVLYAIGIACDHFFGRAKSPMSEPIPEDDDVLEEAIPPD